MPAIEHAVSPEIRTEPVKKASPPPKSKKNKNSAEGLTPGGVAEKNVQVRGWKKLKQQIDQDLMLFKITEEVTLKMEWDALPDNVKTWFTEVLATVKSKGEGYDSETDGECFVFGFADEVVSVSAVCTTLNGKTAFFYKEELIG